MQFPDMVDLAIPFFLVTLLAEACLSWFRSDIDYELKDTLASLSMGIGNVLVGSTVGVIVYYAYVFVYGFRIFDLGYAWWVFPLCFFAEDFAYYWFHRIGHESRWFWASHVIHHSSQKYNLSTALRQTWTSSITMNFIFHLPLLLLGFPPPMVFFFQGLSLVYQYWIHTEAIGKMPRWFEAVANTPSHHRVHHATNPRYLDANYAGVLIVWDRLMGTFVAEREDERPAYGIVKNLDTYNPLRIAFHEWAAIARDVTSTRNPAEIRKYLFGPPGWSPDGSRQTTADIKAAWRHQQGRTQPQGNQDADQRQDPACEPTGSLLG